MTRVYTIVEGESEEVFVNEVLAEHLIPGGVYLTPVILGKPGHKGGRTSYARVRDHVIRLLKQDKPACCSTMLDYYGLGKGFPGESTSQPSASERVGHLERSMAADIHNAIPELRVDARFVPYLQIHEFEALLFSAPETFASAVGQPGLGPVLRHVRDQFATPEEINDDPNSAPSKRILAAYPRYRKVIDGAIGAKSVGLARMLAECSHFRQWVGLLRKLSASPR